MRQYVERRPLATAGALGIKKFYTEGPSNSEIAGDLQAQARIVVTPTTGQKWRAALGICAATAPLVMSAGVLISRGHGASAILELWHAGSDAWALRGRLEIIAATVVDGELKGMRRAKNGSPVDLLETRAAS